jgi:hypothetical protein
MPECIIRPLEESRRGSGWRRGLTEAEARAGMGVGNGQRGDGRDAAEEETTQGKNRRGYVRAGKQSLGADDMLPNCGLL